MKLLAAVLLLALPAAARAQPAAAARAAALLGAELPPAAVGVPPSSPAFSPPSGAALETGVPEVGPHYPFLTFTKNQNPQNVMKIYSRLDAECRLAADGRPPFDFYWLMDGTRYKQVNGTITGAVRDRLPVVAGSAAPDGFSVALNDLAEMKQDIPSPRLTVKAARAGGRCKVAAYMTLGPSDGGVTILLTGIYSEAHRSWRPPYFQTVDAVTLTGVDVATGRAVARRCPAK